MHSACFWINISVLIVLAIHDGENISVSICSRFTPIIMFNADRLAGSYEALAGGQTGDALVDFTGGVNDSVDIREGGYRDDEAKQLELFHRLLHGSDHHKALISCSIAVRFKSVVMVHDVFLGVFCMIDSIPRLGFVS